MGTYDEGMPATLGPWHESIDLGLDTFVEENSYWRSLCHAWSAHPVLEFHREVLGVQPTSPGFTSIRVQPKTLGLEHAEGSVCTPRGQVEVAWKIQAEGFQLTVQSPLDTPTEICLPNGSRHQTMGGNWAGQSPLSLHEY